MTIGEYIRLKGFKIINKISKDSIQKYEDEMSNFELRENKYLILQNKLKIFLQKAQQSTILYKKKENEFDLNNYPVISKTFISNNFDILASDSFSNQELIKVTTSGSYGTPFTFYLTPEKKRRQSAEVIYYSKKAEYNVGISHAYFRTELKKSKLKLWLQNETYICSKILGEDFLINTRNLLKKKKIKILIGFPSAIALLAEYCLSHRDCPSDFSICGVLTFAENLTHKQQENISKLFGCKVVSRYGTEELGIIGYREDKETGFLLNTYNYIVEVLKINEDISVKPGELGRVVVTDLHSDAFPLIRYETGDLAILGDVFEENPNWAKSLKALSGRTIQIINATNGEKLYPLFFENIIEKYHSITQYQLIQESVKKYSLRLVPKLNVEPTKSWDDELLFDMKNWLGNDAEINIEIVDDIEMLPSGKRPSIVKRI